MEWSDIKNTIRDDLLGRNLREPRIRLQTLDRLEALLGRAYPTFLRDPHVLRRVGKGEVSRELSRLKALEPAARCTRGG
jgi:hypothetical protein